MGYRLRHSQEGTFGASSISSQSRDEEWLTSGGTLGLGVLYLTKDPPMLHEAASEFG